MHNASGGMRERMKKRMRKDNVWSGRRHIQRIFGPNHLLAASCSKIVVLGQDYVWWCYDRGGILGNLLRERELLTGGKGSKV